MKIKTKLILFLGFTIHFCAHAQQENNPCQYFQIDAFFFDHQSFSWIDNNNSNQSTQVFTARPAVEFCFASNEFVFRPIIALNPYENSTQGTISAGYLSSHNLEIGLTTQINHSEKSNWFDSNLFQTVVTQFQIGAYLTSFLKISDNHNLELTFKTTYDYISKKNTYKNCRTLISDQKGLVLSTKTLIVFSINDKLDYVPNIKLSYSYMNEAVGFSTDKNVYRIQLLPLSIRWHL